MGRRWLPMTLILFHLPRRRQCRAVSVAAATLALGACAMPDRPARLQAGALEAVPCEAEVRSAVREWGADPARYLGAPSSTSGARSMRFPTRILGAWVILNVPPLGPPVIARATPEEVSARLFDPSCDFEERRVPRPSTASGTGGRFTDDDLRNVLESSAGRPVIVYAWAPHMPLSVDGHVEIARAAASVGAQVVPLLIGHSDRGFAEREAGRVGIPAAGLREIDSNELVFRDLQVHAPAILVFAAGRVSPVLPGFRKAEGYQRYLRGLLGSGGS